MRRIVPEDGTATGVRRRHTLAGEGIEYAKASGFVSGDLAFVLLHVAPVEGWCAPDPLRFRLGPNCLRRTWTVNMSWLRRKLENNPSQAAH